MRASYWPDFFAATWPILLAYAAGVVVAVAMMGRHRTPAVLVLVSMVLYVVAMVGPSVYQQWVFAQPRPATTFLASSRWVYIAANVVRAAAMVCLIVAAFAGRSRAGDGYAFDVIASAAPPPPYPPRPGAPYDPRVP